MSQPRRGLGADRAARLARACDDVAEVTALVGPDAARALARLRGPDVGEHEVDAVLAEVEDILRRHGLAGSGGPVRGGPAYQPLPGVGGGRPLEEVHVCPGDLCDRVEVPELGAAAPTCAVWDCPLPLFRVDR
jgi:hypothetical protein